MLGVRCAAYIIGPTAQPACAALVPLIFQAPNFSSSPLIELSGSCMLVSVFPSDPKPDPHDLYTLSP